MKNGNSQVTKNDLSESEMASETGGAQKKREILELSEFLEFFASTQNQTSPTCFRSILSFFFTQRSF